MSSTRPYLVSFPDFLNVKGSKRYSAAKLRERARKMWKRGQGYAVVEMQAWDFYRWRQGFYNSPKS